jgi:hypothetical protein
MSDDWIERFLLVCVGFAMGILTAQLLDHFNM